MDQPTSTSKAPDSTMLVTMTAGQLRELVRDAIQAASTTQRAVERMLTGEEAAEIVSTGTDWLNSNDKKVSFTRKLGHKMLQFSEKGIIKWLATKKVN